MSIFGYIAAKSILEYLSTSRITLELHTRQKKDSKLLSLLVGTGDLAIDKLDEAVGKSIINEAKTAVSQLKVQKKLYGRAYLDHVCSDSAYISYAIQQKAFDKRELKILRDHLDHEKSLQQFCQVYSPLGIVESTRNRLLSQANVTSPA